MADLEPVKLTPEEALALLDVEEGGYVHTFRNPVGLLVGARWTLEKVRSTFAEHGAELAGEEAMGMKHGVVSVDQTGAVFFATKAEKHDAL